VDSSYDAVNFASGYSNISCWILLAVSALSFKVAHSRLSGFWLEGIVDVTSPFHSATLRFACCWESVAL
jgi:hypothetical protein